MKALTPSAQRALKQAITARIWRLQEDMKCPGTQDAYDTMADYRQQVKDLEAVLREIEQ